jgi:thymidine phosphorylase
VTVAGDAGLTTVAWLTDMNQALGHHVGNALEVLEAIDFLTGRRREVRLHAVTATLARELLVLGGLARDHAEAAGLAVRTAMTVDEAPPAVAPPVLHRIGAASHRRP